MNAIFITTALIGGIIAVVGFAAAITSNRDTAARHRAKEHERTCESAHH